MAVIELDAAVSPFSGQETDFWGSINVNGVQFTSPTDGYFVIKGAERAFKWDIQDGLMLIGATEFFRGRTPPQFTLECSFWEHAQYARFLELIKPFNYNPQLASPLAAIRAVTIYHPALDAIGINAVICEGIGAPEQVSDDHMWKATIKLREYFPLLPFPPQDKDTAPEPSGDPTDPALNDLQQQKADLANQATAIAKSFKTL